MPLWKRTESTSGYCHLMRKAILSMIIVIPSILIIICATQMSSCNLTNVLIYNLIREIYVKAFLLCIQPCLRWVPLVFTSLAPSIRSQSWVFPRYTDARLKKTRRWRQPSGNPQETLQIFLKGYRSAPSVYVPDAESPAAVMIGRLLRIKLDALKLKPDDHWVRKYYKTKLY